MPKNTSKKKYKVDPIVRLAEKNRRASLTAMQFDKNQSVEYENLNTNIDEDLERDRFFKEMKRREF